MAWKQQVLVLASVTATSPDLLDALRKRADKAPTAYTLLLPAPPGAGGVAEAEAQLKQAVQRFQEAGLEIEGIVGDCDPMVAVTETYDPRKFDEIIVSTLPMSVSKWLHADLPLRIERHTGALVSHLVAHPAKPEPHLVHLEKTDDDLGVIK